MIVEAPAEFWDWFVHLADADRLRHDLVLALMLDLYDLSFPPDRDAETATLARVRDQQRHPLWRLSATAPGGAPVRMRGASVRMHCAFPVATGVALIASHSGDTARIGDLFHSRVVARTDGLVEHWLRDRAASRRSPQPGLTRGFESGDEHVALALAQLGVAARVSALRDSMRERDSLRVAALAEVRAAASGRTFTRVAG